MAATKTQRLRAAGSAEAAGRVLPDTSAIAHRFADGWTIRRLATCGDVRREGLLMRHCVSRYAAEAHVRHPLMGVQLDHMDDDAPAPCIDRDHMLARMMPGRYFGQRLYSLRDENNLPHVTWWAKTGDPVSAGHACDVHGYRNCAPKAEYLARVAEWATDSRVHLPAGDADERLLEIDGVCSMSGVLVGLRLGRMLFEEEDEAEVRELLRQIMLEIGRYGLVGRGHLRLILARRAGHLTDSQRRKVPAARRIMGQQQQRSARKVDLLWRKVLTLSARTHATGLSRRQATGRTRISRQLHLR